VTLEFKSNIYFTAEYNMRNVYASVKNLENKFFGLHVPSVWDRTLNADNKGSMCLATNTIYCAKESFWNSYRREKFAKKIIKNIDFVSPGLVNNYEILITATPCTLYRWSGNNNGAAYGWGSTIAQFGDPDFSQKTKIKNLYAAGHWTNQSSGVSFVANTGFDAAQLIIKKFKK
jgi:phytoene dehydrogenase-like protein